MIRHLHRTGLLIVEWLAALAAGLALLAGFAFWHMSGGPVSLDWLAPTVAQALANAEPGLVVRVDHTQIGLASGPRLMIFAHGVHLKRSDGSAEMALSDLSLSLSAQAALRGTIAPERIRIIEPTLHLVRSKDGTFHIGLGAEEPGSGDWAENFLQALAQPPDEIGNYGYLTELEVQGAVLTVDDRALGVTWQAKRADATLFRRPDGMSGDMAFAIERGGKTAQFHTDFRYEIATQHVGFSLNFDDLQPALFADAAAALHPLAAVDLAVAGQMNLGIDVGTRRVSDFWCDVHLGAGTIVDPRLEGGRIAIAQGALKATYDPVAGRINLEKFDLDLQGPKLGLTGSLSGLGAMDSKPLDLAATLEVRQVAVDDFPRYWPAQIGVHARDWITQHVHDGSLQNAKIKLAAKVDMRDTTNPGFAVDSMDGALDYRNLTIDYFHPLAPVRNIDGTATISHGRIDLMPTSGMVRDVKITNGAVHLIKLDTDNEEAVVDLNLHGPLSEVLEVLDTKPLGYAKALKIDPSHVGGTVDGQVHFQLPMKKGMRFSQIDFGAQAKLDQVSIAHLLFGRDLDHGDLRLQLNRAALHIDGTANLAGVMARIDWTESLGNEPVKTRYKLATTLDEEARKRLGFDFAPEFVSGPVGVVVSYAAARAGDAQADVVLDLKDAVLDISQLGWQKPTAVPASAHFTLDLHPARPMAIRNLAIESQGLDARMDITTAEIAGVTSILRADVHRLAVGKTDVTAVLTRREEGGWRVELRGKTLDVTALLDRLENAPVTTTPDPPFVIDANLDRLILGPGREARSVRAQLFSDGVHWQAASVDAIPASGSKLTLRLGEHSGDRHLRLTTDDFGGLLRLLDISTHVQGGNLTIDGKVEDAGPRRILRGKFDGSDYTVIGAPAFARLLSVASFSGVSALLDGNGIPFTRVEGDFVLDNGMIDLTNARAYGEAIGINADGRVDYARDSLNLNGTLVPAYTVNSILDNIPLLGDLLMGGTGQGLFGANFNISGPTANPSVSVNPLSALAPGFLRKLFLFDASGPDQAPAAPAADDSKATAKPSGG